MEGQSCSKYEFPEPVEHLSELDIEKGRYSPEEQLLLYNNLSNATPNTPEQQNILEEICSDIENNRSKLYFIQGMGGSGKSALCKKLSTWTLSKEKICLAATIHEDFNIAHIFLSTLFLKMQMEMKQTLSSVI